QTATRSRMWPGCARIHDCASLSASAFGVADGVKQTESQTPANSRARPLQPSSWPDTKYMVPSSSSRSWDAHPCTQDRDREIIGVSGQPESKASDSNSSIAPISSCLVCSQMEEYAV